MNKMTVRVDWKVKFGNEPRLEVLGLENKVFDFVYKPFETETEATVWVGITPCTDFAMGFVESPNNRHGFGGRVFVFKTENGPVSVKGPWSGSDEVYNRYLPEEYVEVSVNGHGWGIMIKKSILSTVMPEGTYLTVSGNVRMKGTSEDEEGLYASKTMNGGIYKKVKGSTGSYWVWDYDKEKKILAAEDPFGN